LIYIQYKIYTIKKEDFSVYRNHALTMSYHIYLDHILSNFSADVGIDLGTAYTPVTVKGKGIVSSEPTYVARDVINDQIIAVGLEAKAMEGRTHSNIEVIRPVRDGVIADFDIAEKLLHHFMQKARVDTVIKPRVIIGVPTDCTDVEWRAVTEAAQAAGARRVYIIEQPVAAAIGAGLPVMQAKGSMIVDIGGGTSEAAVISLGQIVRSKHSRIAGDEMDEAIQNYVRYRYNMLIGIRTAEELKITLGNARRERAPHIAMIRGRDLTSGLPITLDINSNEVFDALIEIVQSLTDLVKQTLESTPPELVSDIYDQGIILTGGGSKLHFLDEVLTEATGIICRYAEDPMSSVANGIDRIFKNPKMFKSLFMGKEKQMQLQMSS
jgi:rod shape-determining protein MreB and related proteins